jgi:Zn ribbon nucleic-acid-binding protein
MSKTVIIEGAKMPNCKGTILLICPYCGTPEWRDNWELEDQSDNHECTQCGEHYSYERETLPSYTSYKKP